MVFRKLHLEKRLLQKRAAVRVHKMQWNMLELVAWRHATLLCISIHSILLLSLHHYFLNFFFFLFAFGAFGRLTISFTARRLQHAAANTFTNFVLFLFSCVFEFQFSKTNRNRMPRFARSDSIIHNNNNLTHSCQYTSWMHLHSVRVPSVCVCVDCRRHSAFLEYIYAHRISSGYVGSLMQSRQTTIAHVRQFIANTETDEAED